MAYGPCGGVRADGSCEVAPDPCPFVASPPRSWPKFRSPNHAEPPVAVPAIVADLRMFAGDDDLLAPAADRLAGHVDAVLVGDHVGDHVDFGPTALAPNVVASGLRAIVTLACRGRSARAYRADAERVVDAGVEIILCVTGDHPASRVSAATSSPETFITESLECIQRARDAGAVVAVAESPESPPGLDRAHRLRRKVDAGAQMCFLNHCAQPQTLTAFVERSMAVGAEIPFVAPLPAITDRLSQMSLEHFPGMRVPQEFEGTTDTAESRGRFARLTGELLASGCFAGLNLSGRAHAGTLDDRAAEMARLADIVRAVWDE